MTTKQKTNIIGNVVKSLTTLLAFTVILSNTPKVKAESEYLTLEDSNGKDIIIEIPEGGQLIEGENGEYIIESSEGQYVITKNAKL